MPNPKNVIIDASDVAEKSGHFSGYCAHDALLDFLGVKGIKANAQTKKPFAYVFALASIASLTKENKAKFLKELAKWQKTLGFKKSNKATEVVVDDEEVDSDSDEQSEESVEQAPSPEQAPQQ